VVGNSSYGRNIITDGSTHNNRPDIVTVDDTIKEACLIDVTNPNSHNLHSTMTRKPQKYANLKEKLIRMWQQKTTHIIPPVLSTAAIALNKLHDSFKLLTLRPALFVTMPKALILHT
jgi:hypothetical protein